MNDRLLPYYNEELAGLRTLGAEFAAAHPELAGRLRMGDGAADDPHVERLIQAVAFLNARTARRLDDAFRILSTSCSTWSSQAALRHCHR